MMTRQSTATRQIFRFEFSGSRDKIWFFDDEIPELTTELLEDGANDERCLAWYLFRELYKRDAALLLSFGLELVNLYDTLVPIPLEFGMVNGDGSISSTNASDRRKNRSRSEHSQTGKEIRSVTRVGRVVGLRSTMWMRRERHRVNCIQLCDASSHRSMHISTGVPLPTSCSLSSFTRLVSSCAALRQPRRYSTGSKMQRPGSNWRRNSCTSSPRGSFQRFLSISHLSCTLWFVTSEYADDHIKWHQALGDAVALRDIVITLLKNSKLNAWLDGQAKAGRFGNVGRQ